MGSSERLHVRWNEYEANIKAEFSVFRQNADFFDVTLAVGSNRLRAHKIILSAFSPLLCSIIKSVPLHEHPLIYLRGIPFPHIEALLHYMYHGEVSLSQEDFEDFLGSAAELQVKGLIHNSGNASNAYSNASISYSHEEEEDEPKKDLKRPAEVQENKSHFPLPSHFLSTQLSEEDEDKNVTSKKVKNHPKSINEPEDVSKEKSKGEDTDFGGGASREYMNVGLDRHPEPSESDEDLDFEAYRLNKVAMEEIGVVCLICNKVIRQSYNLSRHFEAYHSNSKTVYECPKCRTRHRTKSGFQGHISKFHKLWKKKNVEMYSVPSNS